MLIQLLISLAISATTHALGLNQTTTDNDRGTRNKFQSTNDDPVDPVVIVPGKSNFHSLAPNVHFHIMVQSQYWNPS